MRKRFREALQDWSFFSLRKRLLQRLSLRTKGLWNSSQGRRTSCSSSNLRPALQKIHRIRLRLTSKESKLDSLLRFPFVAADILSSSAKIADAFIEEIKQPQEDSHNSGGNKTPPAAPVPSGVSDSASKENNEKEGSEQEEAK